jgi:tetratricopeptide (TPR) repeat protein
MLHPDLEGTDAPRVSRGGSALERACDELETLRTLSPRLCSERAAALVDAALKRGDRVARMKASYHLASVCLDRGESAAAERLMRCALRLSEDGDWRARTLAGLGIVSARRAEGGRALALLSAALQRYRSQGSDSGVADCQLHTACVVAAMGKHRDALSMLRAARSTQLEIGNLSKAALPLWFSAEVHADLARLAREHDDRVGERAAASCAVLAMRQAFVEDRSSVTPYVEVGGLLAWGHAALSLGDHDAALLALSGVEAMLAIEPMPAQEEERRVLACRLGASTQGAAHMDGAREPTRASMRAPTPDLAAVMNIFET